MSEVHETKLPGVGVRHEFDTKGGRRVGVISLHSGKRELLLYDKKDPDTSGDSVTIDEEESAALIELLGGSQVSETLSSLHRLEGLSIGWIKIDDESACANCTIADFQVRRLTGVSIVAILRERTTLPAPGPEETLLPGDTAVVVGTPEGIEQARALLLRG